MSEVLIHVINSVNTDSVYLNAKLPKLGHVIHVDVDGWPWGRMELTLPAFRIFKAPGMDVSFFQPLVSAEAATQPGQSFSDITNTLQYRGFRFDILHPLVPANIAAYLADDTRAQPFMELDATTGPALQAFIVVCPPIPAPAVIGGAANTIG